MFIDASALVALFSKEAEKPRIDDIVRSTTGVFTSPLAVLEAALALARTDKWNVPVNESGASLLELMQGLDIAVRDAENSLDIARLATEAAARFRKGRRGLNLADCMHYASARHFNVPILATADELRQTDLDVAP